MSCTLLVQSLYTKIMVHHYHLLGAPQAKNLVHYNHVSLKPSFPLLTRKHNTLLSCNTVIEQNNVFFVLLRKWSNGWPVSSVGKWGRQKPRLRAQKSWDVPTLFENQTKSVNVCFRNIQRLHGPSFERTFPDAPFEQTNEITRFCFPDAPFEKQTKIHVFRISDAPLEKTNENARFRFPDAPFEKVNENARFPLFRCSVRKNKRQRAFPASQMPRSKNTRKCAFPLFELR